MILIDANVILDIWDRDPVWHSWSAGQLRRLSMLHQLAINRSFMRKSQPDSLSPPTSIKSWPIWKWTFSIFLDSRLPGWQGVPAISSQGGSKGNVLADFFIGHTPQC